VVRHGRNGLLVPPADPGALAQAVVRLLRHPESARRMGAAGQRDAGAYGIEGIVARIEAMYERLLRSKGL